MHLCWGMTSVLRGFRLIACMFVCMYGCFRLSTVARDVLAACRDSAADDPI